MSDHKHAPAAKPSTSARPSGKRRGGALIVLASIFALLIGIGGATGAAGITYLNQLFEDRGVVIGPDAPGATSPTPAGSGVVGLKCGEKEEAGNVCNYLVLGSDSRSGLSNKDQNNFGSDAEIDGYRSDTMLLVSIDGETRHATIVSFPRDLLVDVPGEPGLDGYGDKNLINSAFSYGAENGGGIEGAVNLTAKTVAQLTGMDINHVVVVDLEGFKGVVDAVGTVPFCTPVSLVDNPQAFPDGGTENGGSGLNLPAGCSDLDGDAALALVRARYVVAGGSKDCISDFARISRQQQFMRSLINKLLSPETLPQLPAIAGAVTKQLTFDSNMDTVSLVKLASAMQGVASGNADFRTVPSELDSQGYHLEITSEGQKFLDMLRQGEDLGDLGTSLAYQPPSPAEISVRVYDDASERHAQDDVYDAQLSRSGFKLMAADAEPAGDLAGLGTVILYNDGQKEAAEVVAGYVPGVKVKAASEGQLPEDTDVGVVVDVDYVHMDPGEGKTEVVEEKCPYL